VRAASLCLTLLCVLTSAACADGREQLLRGPRGRQLARVVIVSIDGIRPSDCLLYPTLKRLAAEGAFAPPPEGALSVLPSVTYPAHTSIATGTHPDRHGITTNHAPDPSPDGKNQNGWRWYAQDIRVPALWDVATLAGLRTALVTWPATVGARATLRLPEYWRANTPEDAKLLRALATPGAWDLIVQDHPDFVAKYTPPRVKDEATIDAALTALARFAPELMLLHIWESDDAAHGFGPDTVQARTAIRHADHQLARLLDALEDTPEWPRTVVVVAGDHGFVPIEQSIVLAMHLETAGLSERFWYSRAGGFAYLYLHGASDQDAIEQARAYFEKVARDPAQGIAHVLTRAEIGRRHGDPEAALGLEATPGFAFSKRRSAEKVVMPAGEGGTHGYLPERPEMRAALIVYGPRIKPQKLRGARLIDIAPTVAPWLGLSMPDVDGKPLPIKLH
jgi:predicted AlkP superfamily pyrophosphatase or phosphodiesterase